MIILPLATARVSNLLQSSVSTENINTTQNQLLVVGQELATGKQVNEPSDNPAAAALIQQLNATLANQAQYSNNLKQGQGQLNEVDSTLGDLTTLVQQAMSVASENSSTTVSADERATAASTIDGIYTQVQSSANTIYGGTYLFGGDDAQNAPYLSTPNGEEFVGSSNTLSNVFDANTEVNFQASATSVFGGQSASVSAGVNIAPVVAATDLVSDLGGTNGNGVSLGKIQITKNGTPTTVDLTGADNLGDVVNDINNAGIGGVTASLTATGLKLSTSGGANITVNEVGGGSTASDLGILHTTASGANVAVVGQSVDSKVTSRTPLTSLRGGAGIDTTGFTITNGAQSKSISLAGLTTVGDLLNAVNNSGLGVSASVNADGTGVDLFNNTQGADLTVSENGGTTATELGFRTLTPSTLLSGLNNGLGVSTPTGDQFSITTADGTVKNISLTSTAQSTVGDVISQINTQGGGKVTASFNTTTNGIVLTDQTTGTGTLTVTPQNASTTASDLGLTGTATAGKITGTDVNPVEAPGVFTDLQALRVALRANDTNGINNAATKLTADRQQITDVQGIVGSREQELTSRATSQASENVSTQALLSQYQDVDYSTVVTQYQTLQNSLQASLELTARSLSVTLLDYLT